MKRIKAKGEMCIRDSYYGYGKYGKYYGYGKKYGYGYGYGNENVNKK